MLATLDVCLPCRQQCRGKAYRAQAGYPGSPTCELQFNDTPAQLVGKRKMGLIKYVLDLMYRARMGVSAQALGSRSRLTRRP
jgi:alkylation response protein AidB-like acyl-CoA dehydrogenase